MTKEEIIRIRAYLIELDKGIMQQHSAIRGLLSMIEKSDVVEKVETETVTKMVYNTEN